MNVHEEALHSSSILYGENGANVEAADNLDLADFFIVTEVPVETFRFKWMFNKFGNKSSNEQLYSSPISCQGSCFQLKLIKYENGFELFHFCGRHCNKMQIESGMRFESGIPVHFVVVDNSFSSGQ
ncbi:hypothetical protein NPIL_256511 [Nephila pilipes]|uniref:Uncharacterized protein n=1 Tax=Nephila pilipes TaxID=299642 RepID=A0A8X6QFB6_NEPPI|nr:hypothetical protein NPIL_256511 [Nephila pilipes]